jgi:pimeloyl-ACP methyl ester carboxylesterase
MYNWILTPWMLCLPALAIASVTASASSQQDPERRLAVDEGMYVPIGGIDQWVTIKGQDASNPVVLVLHGGPGASFSPYDDTLFGAWRRYFTVVQWDQRGAGRTYTKNAPPIESTMTIDRMVEDGIEVSEFLENHLRKQKIAVFGGSWGSLLGIYMVKRRPDLFCAYVGTAQMVRSDFGATYKRVLVMAEAARDEAAIKDLTTIGPPPWNSFKTFMVFIRWVGAYEAKHATPLYMIASPEYASPQEREAWGASMTFSVQHFFGKDLSGPLMKFDLGALGTDFKVPVFIVQGEDDLRAPPDIAREYFDSIRAPRKQFFDVPSTGHEPSAASIAVVWKVLLERARPLCSPQ